MGLNTIPSGRWQCRECTYCVSCGVRDPEGTEGQKSEHRWVTEFKQSAITGNKIYQHTICLPCHRACRRMQFCPACNVVFGKERNVDAVEYTYCMVCSRQHHIGCVGQAIFICSNCQRKTQEKFVGGAGNAMSLGSINASLGGMGSMASPAATPTTGGLRSSRRSALATSGGGLFS